MTVNAYNQTMTQSVVVRHDAQRLQGVMGERVTVTTGLDHLEHTELSLLVNRDPGT